MAESAHRHFEGRFKVGADVPADLTDRMRDLVTKLAHTHDGPEEKLHRERRLEDFTAQTGDREEAQRLVAAEEAGRTGSLNLLSMVAASAYSAAANSATPDPTVTELLTIVLSRDLIASAADLLHDSTSRPRAVKVHVGRAPVRECTFDCETDAEVTRDALKAQATELTAEIRAQLKQETDQQQGRVRRFARRPLPAAVSCAAVIAAVPYAVPTGVAAVDFVAPAVAVAAGAGSWLVFLLRRARVVQNTGARELPAISKALQDSADEIADLFAQEDRGARSRAEFAQFLRDLTPGHAYRAVRTVDSAPYPRSRQFPDWTPLPPQERLELGPPDVTRPLY
jgi:hypothetical protein